MPTKTGSDFYPLDEFTKKSKRDLLYEFLSLETAEELLQKLRDIEIVSDNMVNEILNVEVVLDIALDPIVGDINTCVKEIFKAVQFINIYSSEKDKNRENIITEESAKRIIEVLFPTWGIYIDSETDDIYLPENGFTTDLEKSREKIKNELSKFVKLK